MNSKLFVLRNPKFLRFLVYFLILTLIVAFSYPQVAHAAASITAISDTMSRLKISQNSSHVIKFTTGASIQAAADTIVFTFPSDFNFTSKTIATVSFTHGASGTESTELLQATADATHWKAEFSGTNNRIFTLTAPTDGVGTAAVAINDKLIITYDNTNAANGSTATTYLQTIQITGSNPTGPTSFAISLVTDDQVVVSTTIDPYITFELTTTTVTLVNGAGGNPNYTATGEGYSKVPPNAANTLAATTNANTGYTISYSGATLTGPGGTIDAIGGTPAVNNEGTEQFGINLKTNADPATGADPSGGIGAPVADYNTADSFAYEAGSTIPLASAGGSSVTTTFTVSYLVNVTATTEAGAYNSTITYICTGNF